MLIRKLNVLTQIIFFFDKEFKKIIINPKFYQHLFSALVISVPNENEELQAGVGAGGHELELESVLVGLERE